MKMFSHREVELFQLWARRKEIDRIINLLKYELKGIYIEVAKIQKLVNEEKKEV